MLVRLTQWLDRASGLIINGAGGLRHGFARTDTSDCSAPRGRRRFSDMWIHRISCRAEEQATRTRVLPSGLLLWIHGGPDPAQKASRPERTRSRRPVRRRASTYCLDASRRRSFRRSHAPLCGISCTSAIVAPAVAPPDEPAAPAGIRAITNCHASWNGERVNARSTSAIGVTPTTAVSSLAVRVYNGVANRLLVTESDGDGMRIGASSGASSLSPR